MIKNRSIKFLAAIMALICVIVPCLTSCLPTDLGEDMEEVKEHTLDFLREIKKGDYEEAAKYLHPERPADLQRYFENIEEDRGIDFQSGITVKGYGSMGSNTYFGESDVTESYINLYLEVSGKELHVYVVVMDNPQGYGICEFEIY
ncbi:MAG: hypothetical protein IJW19_06395 [Clostridia bacterium]|nr:hypothetical protein [Clostridia bacterium]